MKKILVSMFAILSISSAAHAGFFIEPFLGYAVTGKEDDGGSADIKGMDYGARLGATFAMFSIGAEYAGGSYEQDVSSGQNFDTTDIGLTFAFDFPIMLRLYATYFLKSEAKPDSGTTEKGDGGYRIGIGYTGLPFVDINIEMVKRMYDDPSDYGFSTTQIGLSVPLP